MRTKKSAINKKFILWSRMFAFHTEKSICSTYLIDKGKIVRQTRLCNQSRRRKTLNLNQIYSALEFTWRHILPVLKVLDKYIQGVPSLIHTWYMKQQQLGSEIKDTSLVLVKLYIFIWARVRRKMRTLSNYTLFNVKTLFALRVTHDKRNVSLACQSIWKRLNSRQPVFKPEVPPAPSTRMWPVREANFNLKTIPAEMQTLTLTVYLNKNNAVPPTTTTFGHLDYGCIKNSLEAYSGYVSQRSATMKILAGRCGTHVRWEVSPVSRQSLGSSYILKGSRDSDTKWNKYMCKT